jgi:methyl-accepting chemotaxis protein
MKTIPLPSSGAESGTSHGHAEGGENASAVDRARIPQAERSGAVNAGYTKPQQGRLAQLAFGSAIVVLLVVGSLSYRSIVISSENSGWVQHTHEVLENLDASQFAMETIAGSVRGFALTGNETYLERYQASVLSLAQHEAAVRSLTVDNPEQQLRMTALETITAERLQRAKMNITMPFESGPVSKLRVILRRSLVS